MVESPLQIMYFYTLHIFTEIIQASHLSLFGHVACIDDKLVFNFIAFCGLEETGWWLKTVQNTLDSHRLSWTEALDLSQN